MARQEGLLVARSPQQASRLRSRLMMAISSRLPSRATRRLRPDRAPVLRLRPAEGLVVLPRRRRLRRPHPGGPRRPLQGRARLPHRPRVELPQLRGALHHAPDHHRGQDGDAQQAHAAEPATSRSRDARRRARATASRRSTRSSRARPSTTRSTRSSPPRSCSSLVGCLSTALSELESRVLSLYLDGRSYEEIGERLGCDTRRSTTRSSASSARSARTSSRAT